MGRAVREGCLRSMLQTRETVKGPGRALRLYRCLRTGKVCVLSGNGPDQELLLLVCENCPAGRVPRKKSPPRQ